MGKFTVILSPSLYPASIVAHLPSVSAFSDGVLYKNRVVEVKTTVIVHAHLTNIVSSYHNLVTVHYSCARGALGRPLMGIY